MNRILPGIPVLLMLLGTLGCSGGEKASLPPEAQGSATVLLSDHWTLNNDGAAVKFRGSDLGRPFIITNEGGSYHALDSWCTHQGCEISPKSSAEELECPCHASGFSLSGEVLKGPAPTAMIRYALEQRGDTLIVDFSQRTVHNGE